MDDLDLDAIDKAARAYYESPGAPELAKVGDAFPPISWDKLDWTIKMDIRFRIRAAALVLIDELFD